jgi:D-alanine-D-alanine ligase
MKTIAVIFGGKSTEHDVSIITALTSIIRPLKTAGGYEVEPVYISKEGNWYWDAKLADISLYQSGEIEDFMRRSPKTHLLFDDGLTLVKSSQFAGRKQYKKVDVVFPAMHGTHGEDGELMGLLEMAGVPYVGCGPTASAIAMDKVLAKQVVESNGLPVAKYEHLYRDTYLRKNKAVVDELQKSLKFPLFVKPAHLGSSIGISRVTNDGELENAIEVALHYDEKIVIEEEVQNLIEVTLPIMGNEELKVAYLERPIAKSDQFFDFDTKYMRGGKSAKSRGGSKTGAKGAQGYSELPAKIDKKLEEKAVELGKRVYRILECSGIARIDMLIDEKSGVVYFNEVNPLPGSLYAHNWRASGVSNVQLVEDLVYLAEQRFKKKQRLATTFETSFLKQF